MPEGLFDIVTDPHQLRNLAASSAYLDVLDRMRARLTQWEVETRDIGFMDEAEVLRLADRTGQTPLEFTADPSVYPLTRVLDTATLVGQPRAANRQAAFSSGNISSSSSREIPLRSDLPGALPITFPFCA